MSFILSPWSAVKNWPLMIDVTMTLVSAGAAGADFKILDKVMDRARRDRDADGATNSVPSFTTNGSGTHLTRNTTVDGTDIQINSGHAYNRPHSGGDVSQIGTMDEIETAILNDILDLYRFSSDFLR